MLSGRLAWVTGGGRGIGQSVSQILAREGARVVVSDLSIESCQETLQSLGDGDHFAVANDVSKMSSVKDAMKQILEKYKSPPDAVVNSAGITMDGYLLRMTEEAFDRVIAVNLKGTFLVNQVSAAAMKDAKVPYGSIVNISSISGQIGNAGQANYSSSKAGVIGFTRTSAKELAKFNIRVNCICPGFIKTPMSDAVPDHIKEIMKFQIPFGEFGEPEDIAEAAAFLLSKKAKYISGTTLSVNGALYN